MSRAMNEIIESGAPDGHRIALRMFEPDGAPAGIIQVLHGLGEHAGRYRRFAEAAVGRGFAVVVHDHRGHGEHPKVRGFFALDKGWQRLTEDVLAVQEFAIDAIGVPRPALLGHSMGSFIAQQFAMLHGARLSALLLSGSTWPSRAQVLAGNLLAREEATRLGAKKESPLLDKLGFGKLNRPFEPARTPYDWLSSDEQEVDAYVADPLCGGPFASGLWRDLTGGMLAIASDDALSRIPADLPILITGGGADPLGGDRGLGNLALHYAQTGHQRLAVKIYENGRHEMLNERNRDEVTADWLDWFAKVMRT
jgi:alpha-beta hydrolase superfamily lysophospholipase